MSTATAVAQQQKSLPDILEIIIACVDEAGDLYGYDALKNPSPETRLYGEGGALDSVGLVSLIIDVEEKIATASGVAVSLATEKALSRKQSPFATVKTLADFCTEQLREAGCV